MPRRDPRVDAYIAKAAPFAQPILRHLRAVVHQACPEVVETIKWSNPSFLYRDRILCGMAAFKAHCIFGFWHGGMTRVLAADFGGTVSAMGFMGRISSLHQLPSDKKLRDYIARAMQLIASGAPSRVAKPRTPRPEAKVPADLAAALRKSQKAAVTFENFSPSHRREYIEWITEAKREETRAKRLATTLEWLSAGKPRNWKYLNC